MSPERPRTLTTSAPVRTSMPSSLRMRCISSATSESSRPKSRGPLSDDRHPAPKTAESLSHFDADITAAKHDQVRRHVAQFERLDVG